jgi:uncharacterized protein (TIGR02145 family)
MATYIQKLAPSGFHILTKSEAEAIVEVLGGNSLAGNAMKEPGTAHWNTGNTGTNESDLTVLGAGFRADDAEFDGYREQGIIWLADEGDEGYAYAMQLTRDSAAVVFGQLLKGYGLSVRLAMDDPSLYVPGMTVTDRDGNIYDLVRVSREEVPLEVKYGLLYNWYAATDARKITSSDTWDVPDSSIWYGLMIYLDPAGTYSTNISGGKLKETGTEHWDTPNSGAINSVNFNAKGSGLRVLGNFMFLHQNTVFWNKDERNASNARVSNLFYDSESLNTSNVSIAVNIIAPKNTGNSIRLSRPATPAELEQEDGTACANYVGNDGKSYPTVKIGTQVWLADNLCETRYRNGDYITGFNGGTYTPISNEAWAAATEGMVCAYNDDLSNAFTGSPAINIVLTKQNWASTKYADGTDIELAQEDEEWTEEGTDGKFCNYDDAYVIDIPPIINGEVSSWFSHNRRMGVVGFVDPRNLATTVQLEYGPDTDYGTTIDLDSFGAGVTEAEARSYIIPRLTPGTYHWRLVATNSAGTTYGEDQEFTIYPGTNRDLTDYVLDTFTGTTYFIDPDAATNGDGLTAETPMNAYPATMGSNNIYQQKAGTTATFSGNFSTINGPCKITHYGTGTRPEIICTQVNSDDLFRFLRTDYKMLIQNVVLSKADTTGIVVYIVNAPGTTLYNCDISGGFVPVYTQAGGAGLNEVWSGVKVLYCDIHRAGNDGMYFRYTTDVEVGHCYIYDINRDYFDNPDQAVSSGDCIQVASGGSASVNVHHCTLDHSTTGNKFNFIIYSNNSSFEFKHNHVIGSRDFQGHPVSGIYIHPNTYLGIVHGNIFENHNIGIFNQSINLIATYNLFVNQNKCITTLQNYQCKAYNNVFYGYVYNALERLTGASLTAKNNVFKSLAGYAFSLSGSGTQVIDYNHFDGIGAAPSGTNYTTGDSKFTDVADMDFYPDADENSPLINSGVNVDLSQDFDGVTVSVPPSKGLYE